MAASTANRLCEPPPGFCFYLSVFQTGRRILTAHDWAGVIEMMIGATGDQCDVSGYPRRASILVGMLSWAKTREKDGRRTEKEQGGKERGMDRDG